MCHKNTSKIALLISSSFSPFLNCLKMVGKGFASHFLASYVLIGYKRLSDIRDDFPVPKVSLISEVYCISEDGGGGGYISRARCFRLVGKSCGL